MKINKWSCCPECNESWDAGPIENKEHYSPPYRFSSLIAMIEHDRCQFYVCPFCDAKFKRGDVSSEIDGN